MLQWLFKKKNVDVPPSQENTTIIGSDSEIKADGSKVAAAIAIAAQHQSAGRYLEAEASFKSFLAVNPENSEALRMLGALKLQVGQHDNAAALLSRASAGPAALSPPASWLPSCGGAAPGRREPGRGSWRGLPGWR